MFEQDQAPTAEPTRAVGTASRRDIPAASERRWSPKRKAQVVDAMRAGVLSFESACERYALSPEELTSWQEAMRRHGMSGLKSRKLNERRREPRRVVREACEARLGPASRTGCQITDLSAGGARVEFRSAFRVPGQFELKCLRTDRTAWVEVAWQRDRTVGVRFRAPPAAPLMAPVDMDGWLMGERD